MPTSLSIDVIKHSLLDTCKKKMTDQLLTETEVPAKTQNSKSPKWIRKAFKEAVTLSRHISMLTSHVIHMTNIHNKCFVMDLIMKETHAVG